jgi:putative transposase
LIHPALLVLFNNKHARVKIKKANMNYAHNYANFITITCLEWKHILAEDEVKKIIIDALEFLVINKRIRLYAFVVMDNHLHLIWQMLDDNKSEDVQRDFLKYTAQQILKHFRNTQSPLMNGLYVGALDRKYQVWERNSLSIPVYSENVIMQKL